MFRAEDQERDSRGIPGKPDEKGTRQAGGASASGWRSGDPDGLPAPSSHSTELSSTKHKEVKALILFRLLQWQKHPRSKDQSVSPVVLSRYFREEYTSHRWVVSQLG